MARIICLIIGYCCGLFQSGYIIGRIKGIDIREHGSKNSGTTNILRTMGLKYAVFVLLLDALKTGIAIFIIYLIYGNSYADYIRLFQIYGAFGVVLGHNYPFYMKFKGGKGIAATAGFIIFGLPPVITLFSIIIFFGTFFITHYVSLGSMLLYIGLIIEMIALGEYWYRHPLSDGKLIFFNFPVEIARGCLIEFYVVLILLCLMAFWRHRENIMRLVKGTERKTYLKAKPEIDVNNKEK